MERTVKAKPLTPLRAEGPEADPQPAFGGGGDQPLCEVEFEIGFMPQQGKNADSHYLTVMSTQ